MEELMSVRKALYLFMCGMCVMGLVNCGEGKYADAKKVTVKYLDAMEGFASETPETCFTEVSMAMPNFHWRIADRMSGTIVEQLHVKQ